jgi:hypothetical protein
MLERTLKVPVGVNSVNGIIARILGNI